MTILDERAPRHPRGRNRGRSSDRMQENRVPEVAERRASELQQGVRNQPGREHQGRGPVQPARDPAERRQARLLPRRPGQAPPLRREQDPQGGGDRGQGHRRHGRHRRRNGDDLREPLAQPALQEPAPRGAQAMVGALQGEAPGEGRPGRLRPAARHAKKSWPAKSGGGRGSSRGIVPTRRTASCRTRARATIAGREAEGTAEPRLRRDWSPPRPVSPRPRRKRDAKIAKTFDEDQLETFAQTATSKGDMLTIARVKDPQQRAEIISLIASGMDADEAIKEVMKDKAPTRYGRRQRRKPARPKKASRARRRRPPNSPTTSGSTPTAARRPGSWATPPGSRPTPSSSASSPTCGTPSGPRARSSSPPRRRPASPGPSSTSSTA